MVSDVSDVSDVTYPSVVLGQHSRISVPMMPIDDAI
jgi:hypothetical protein